MKVRSSVFSGVMLGGMGLLASGNAQALNYFELEVYPYATAAKGELELENNTTHTSRGTRSDLPEENNKGLTRSSFELNYGVTEKTELAWYIDYSRARGGDWQHAADRVRARTRFFEKGELPVDLGLYAELEFPKNQDNDVEVELRGIIEKDVGKWTFDFNPIFEKVLKGTDNAGWEFQYAASAIYRLNERWRPRLDFFGDFGPIRHFEPKDEQKHLVSPAVDIKLGRGVSLTAGVAFGYTKASEQQLIRAKLEWEFY
jgi:hypothetical protein